MCAQPTPDGSATRFAREAGSGLPPVRIALEVGSLDRGGLEALVAELALGLPRFGIDPIVICTRAGGAQADRLRSAGVRVEILSSGDPGAEVARLLAHHDVAALSAHYSAVGTPVAAAAGIPVVVTLHNAYAWEGSGVSDAIRSLDASVAVYVAVSESVAVFSRERFAIDPVRIVVIRNSARALRVDRAPERRAAAKAELGLPADAELVVHVARVERLKCQLATVAAIEDLARTRTRLFAWIVGGVGEPDYADEVARAIAATGLGDRLLLTGNRDDMVRLLEAADVFVLPSAVEGSSVAALEAVGAGVPSILTRTGDAEFLLGADARDGVARPPAGALIDGPWPDPAAAAACDWQALRDMAAASPPPHAPSLAAALAGVLDDLPARSTRAAERAAELAGFLTPERLCRDYADLLLRVIARASSERAAVAASAAERVAAELERERAASDELRATLAATQETMAAEIHRLVAESAEARRSLAEIRDTSLLILGKLRLSRRIESAARDLEKRVRRLVGRERG